MNQDTILLRQVHPSFVQGDQVSSQAFSVTSQVFRPTPKDENRLSVYNGEKFTAEESHLHFTSIETNRSFGVLGVSAHECNLESLECLEDNNPFDGHTVIYFTGLSKNEIEKKAKRLKSVALNRGWLYMQKKS